MTTYPVPDLYIDFRGGSWGWATSDPVVKLRNEAVQAAGNARTQTTYGTTAGSATTTRLGSPPKYPPLRCEIAACLFDHGLTGQALTSHEITELVNRMRSKKGDKTRREREIKLAQTAFPGDFETAPKLLSYKPEIEGSAPLMFMMVPLPGILRSDPVFSAGYELSDIPDWGQPMDVSRRWLYALNRSRMLFGEERTKLAVDLVRERKAVDVSAASLMLLRRTIHEIYRQLYFDAALDIRQAKARAEVKAIMEIL